jgi:hypothetical protein
MVSQDIDVSVVLFTLFHLTILYQAWPSSLLVLILWLLAVLCGQIGDHEFSIMVTAIAYLPRVHIIGIISRNQLPLRRTSDRLVNQEIPDRYPEVTHRK